MKILADENIDQPIVAALREAGHSVISVFEENPGIKDGLVLSQSASTDAILLTGDKDFGEHVFRMKSAHSGVVLLRLFDLNLDVKIRIILELFEKYAGKIESAFVVVEPGKVRIKNET